jgi:23S rRNA (adenine2503-C2)-methyltransferase
MNVLGYTFEALTTLFRIRYGKGAYHAAALYKELFKRGNLTPWKAAAFAKSGNLAQQVATDLEIPLPNVATRESVGELTKIVLRLGDGFEVESVIVPMASHTTICISSQVGCRMGCRFCETAQLGFKRNLDAGEIVAQVWIARHILGCDIRNVVFMGMGEPLDNFDQVTQAMRVLSDQRGLDIAKGRMTLSTAGLVDGLARLAALGWPQPKLAVSLNAASDGVRNRIMPINRRYPLAALRRALLNYPLGNKDALFFEYVLIPGLNDDPADVRHLVEFLSPFRAKVNLIPLNPRRQAPFRAPTQNEIDRFHTMLVQEGLFVRLRITKGHEIMAACGQLGNHRQYAANGGYLGRP